MNASIRRVGVGIVVLFLALVGQLTYLQVFEAESLESNPENVRVFLRDVNRARGPIVTPSGDLVAVSEPLEGGDFEFRRVYPQGPLFGHVSGFQSIVFGNTGVEASYNDDLLGRTFALQARQGLSDLFADQPITGTVVLALDTAAQRLARDALAGRAGSVVVLDVRSGAIVAMYSEPSYDPTPLASRDAETAIEARQALADDPANPELARAYRERYPAGSTFKIVTAAIALDSATAAITPETVYPSVSEIELPLTDRTLENFGGSVCGGTLAESFRRSCNTTFAAIGLELGEELATGMARFGINTAPPPLDLEPGAVASLGPERGTFEREAPTFAQAGIGQADVAVTPLQMAMIAAAVANDGVMMEPHVGLEVRDDDGAVVDRIPASQWRRSMSPETAEILQGFMLDVVEGGTGTRAQIPGIPVAGKTGTAQVGGDRPPHAWFVAFAPADEPVYAVSVLVENGGDLGDDATGGQVAAPVAAQMLSGLLGPGG